MDRIRDSIFFGLMIDESTDVSVTGLIVVFATFVEDGLHVSIFRVCLRLQMEDKMMKKIFRSC